MLELDHTNFDEQVYDTDGVCLVAFSRKTCHVCKEVMPMLEELAGQNTDPEIRFCHVDAEDEQALFKRFPLKGVPSILFFRDGEYKGKLGGPVEEEDVLGKLAAVKGVED